MNMTVLEWIVREVFKYLELLKGKYAKASLRERTQKTSNRWCGISTADDCQPSNVTTGTRVEKTENRRSNAVPDVGGLDVVKGQKIYRKSIKMRL